MFRWFTKFSDELRTLAAWIIGLASLGGFVIAALTEGLEWLVFPALVLAIGVAFRKRFIYGIQALRNYRHVTERLDDLSNEVGRLKSELSSEVARAYEVGRKEGQLEVGGIIAASHMGDPPPLRGVSVIEGDVILIGRLGPVRQEVVDGARFSVRDKGTGEHKGIVMIALIDELSDSIHLQCVEELIPEFWVRLRESAVLDSRPPPNIELVEIPDSLLPSVNPKDFLRKSKGDNDG